MSEKLPVKFELVPETLESPFRDDFPGYTDGMVRGEPGRFFLAPPFGEHAEDIYNFPLKSDDVWIVTFPKCGKLTLKLNRLLYSAENTSAFSYCSFNGKNFSSGTTWVQEILWLLVNDCDFDGAKQDLEKRSPFLE
jgi:Sulfotransferase domain